MHWDHMRCFGLCHLASMDRIGEMPVIGCLNIPTPNRTRPDGNPV